VPPSFAYRITKYNPADRDERGHHNGAEDTVSDHGPVEASYLEAGAAFAQESGIDKLEIREPAVTSFAEPSRPRPTPQTLKTQR
jgi:small subunit ribosomal protein S1